MGQPAWSYEDVWELEPRNIGHARALVGDHLAEHGLRPLCDEVLLVVSELATNAVRYATTGFTVTLKQAHGVVTVAVRDGSHQAPRAQLAGPYASAGRGLALVAAVSSDWGVVLDPDGSKSVWARFDSAHPGQGWERRSTVGA